MAEQFDRRTFERVFSDAHIIDIDFSEWDKKIALWALADHYEDWTHRCPVVVVEFHGILELACKMPPREFGLDAPNEHLQWNIDDFEIDEQSSNIRIRLFGSASSPSLTIECETITFRRASSDTLDQTFPGWNRPYSALARPSIDEISGQQRGRS